MAAQLWNHPHNDSVNDANWLSAPSNIAQACGVVLMIQSLS